MIQLVRLWVCSNLGPRAGRSDLPGQRCPVWGGQGIGQGLDAAGGKPFAGGAGQEGLAAIEAILQDTQHPLLIGGDGGQAFAVPGPQQVSFAIQDGHQFALAGQEVVQQGSHVGFERWIGVELALGVVGMVVVG